jgi:hypothetical protein
VWRKLKQVYTKMLCGERAVLRTVLQSIGLSGGIQPPYVERMNLTIRHTVAALRRRDLGVGSQRAHLTVAGGSRSGLLQLLSDASRVADRGEAGAVSSPHADHGVGGNRACVEREGVHYPSRVLGWWGWPWLGAFGFPVGENRRVPGLGMIS